MKVLVDYKNAIEQTRLSDLALIEKIVYLCAPELEPNDNKLLIRLYSGWYRAKSLTTEAQVLSSKLFSKYPSLKRHSGRNISIQTELAYSLEIMPLVHLHHTLRPRPRPKNLICKPKLKWGCMQANCVLDALPSLVATLKCPATNCTVSPQKIFDGEEQKLVDTMLAADLMHVAIHTSEKVALVSSDDDLWPAILNIIHHNKNIIHIETHNNPRNNYIHLVGGPSKYIQKVIQ